MINFSNEYYYAFIVEGGTEKAIIEILLQNNTFKFNNENVINWEDGILDSPYHGKEIKFYGCPSNFSTAYLQEDYEEKKIIIFVIEDRTNIPYTIDYPYSEKIEAILHVITHPEIEILEIRSLNLLKNFNKSSNKQKNTLKASDFLSNHLQLKLTDIKNYKRTKAYWQKNSSSLINAINTHKTQARKLPKNHIFLADLLK